MACNFEVPVTGEESECYILSPTSCLTDERTLIHASQLEFGKHFTKAPVGANNFRTVQNLLMIFLLSSKTKMKEGLSNMLQCQADVARNLEHLGLAGLLNEAEVRYAIIDPIVKMICGKWDLEVSNYHVQPCIVNLLHVPSESRIRIQSHRKLSLSSNHGV